jgi:TfoX/Sxy family transcriptional regulator of competence genes
MPSTPSYLSFIFDQLSGLDNIACRPMMGEYLLYYRGKLVGGIYDDRFLVKPTPSALTLMPNAEKEIPYDGAKEMLLVDNLDSKPFLKTLLDALHADLPAPKRKPHAQRP